MQFRAAQELLESIGRSDLLETPPSSTDVAPTATAAAPVAVAVADDKAQLEAEVSRLRNELQAKEAAIADRDAHIDSLEARLRECTCGAAGTYNPGDGVRPAPTQLHNN